jgi:superfamily I DNA/RNA helicase
VGNEVLDRDGNRAILLMLRLLSNRHDSLAWAGLLHLERGIGRAFVKSIYDQAATQRKAFSVALLEASAEDFPQSPAASAKKATALVARVTAWLDGREVPEQLNDGRWGAWIVEAPLGPGAGAPLSEDLAGLLLGVDEMTEPGASLGRYLGQIQPLARDRAQAQAAGVRFMSMTSSKGLTVEAAIMVAAEDDVVPRPNADVAEERRLLYVAMTRARRFQYVTWAGRRTGPTARAGAPNIQQRRTESRFLRNGPIQTQDGEAYIQRRWGSDAAVA